MTEQKISKTFTYIIAAVWLVNGLFCKSLNFVPRHQEIVGRILGTDYAKELTFIIGVSEVIMAVWILSGYKRKTNALIQIFIVGIMNILEFMLVPDLLLWGKLNSAFALCFLLLIYYNQFHLSSHKLKTV